MARLRRSHSGRALAELPSHGGKPRLRPSYPTVLPPSRTPRGGVETVAPVDYQPPSGERSCVRGRQLSPVLVPLGEHDHGVGVGPGERSVAVECLVEVRVHTLRIFKSLWISHHHLRALSMQSHRYVGDKRRVGDDGREAAHAAPIAQ